MKVILDIACNHTGRNNKLVDQCPGWFVRDDTVEQSYPEGTDWGDIVELDYDRGDL